MKKRVEETTSRTAEWTCLSRAVSFFETIPCLRNEDYIAPLLLPTFIKPLLKMGFLRKFFREQFAPAGIYEYVIARTRVIDEVFESALDEGFDQILILGAGFDSRAIRFEAKNRRTKIFELDSHHTQRAKLDQLMKRGIRLPANTVYIPIDFNNEKITDRLCEFGFVKNVRTLYIMEGLLMYLEESSVEDLFRIIKESTNRESRVIFDFVYASVLRGENLYFGEQRIFKTVSRAGEGWTFGIERGEMSQFLTERGFTILTRFDAENLEKKFFVQNYGLHTFRVNGTHCLILATMH
jgi:methyltransferase (TIGR00027 family)